MKKYTYIVLALLLVCGKTYAQDKPSLKRANRYFEKKAYTKVAEEYETKLRTQDVLQNLGDSYYYNANVQKAIETYRELFDKFKDSVPPEYNFRYAQVLKAVSNYTIADKYLSAYYNTPVNTTSFIENIEKLTPHRYELNEIINEKSQGDFGLMYFGEGDTLSFASARNTFNPIYSWNNLPYLDLYSATLNEDNTLTNIKHFSECINTKLHESNAVLSKDGKTIYFNRTNSSRKRIDGQRIAHVKIHSAEKSEDKEGWTNDLALPFTSNKYSTQHPALSSDGKTLYFSSDMPGSIGGFDIYRVAINEDGTYGEPENLGEIVNTEHNEVFPYISETDVLYFSSIGHLGFGGLDVFRTEENAGAFSEPLNLGSTVNSGLDDFSFVIKEKEHKGFVSSNRSGLDRMYSFTREENKESKYQVEGIVQDFKTKDLLVGSIITLFDESGKMIQNTIASDGGYYIFDLEPNKKYKVRAKQKAYIPQDIEFSTNNEGNIKQSLDFTLQAFASAEGTIKTDVNNMVQVGVGKIYFGFDDINLIKDSTKKLDILIGIMKKYPSMEIEISAHTDAQGPASYNLTLSQRRAKAVFDYIVSQGIAENRLTNVGYGETKPLNNCVDGSNCDYRDYDINRRCEFTVTN